MFRSLYFSCSPFKSTLLWIVLLLLSAGRFANGQTTFSFERPPIDYHNQPASNHITRLQKFLNAEENLFKFDKQQGYLPALLKALDISASSQVLVFSKTSQQLRLIDSKHPRALYFNDHSYVGWVHGGNVLEIITADNKLGTVFYTLKQEQSPQPKFERDRGQCLICHASRRTQGVPGPMVRSLYTGANGQPAFGLGTFNTDHRSPFRQRWGGYYVTGTHGTMLHMGNKFFFQNQLENDIDLTPGSNLKQLDAFLNTTPYLTAHSDLVALMVLEHQVQMQNFLTLAQFEEVTVTHYDRTLNKSIGRPGNFQSELAKRRIKRVGEQLVRYLLFADEFHLQSPVTGTSKFTTYFASQGLQDRQGRSLRDFDLQARLFKYPLSYQVYSPAFDNLPAGVQGYVRQRLQKILRNQDKEGDFPHLKSTDRAAILEILKATKPELLKSID